MTDKYFEIPYGGSLNNNSATIIHTEYYIPYQNNIEFEIIHNRLKELGYDFVMNSNITDQKFKSYILHHSWLVINSGHNRILFGMFDDFKKESLNSIELNPMGLFTEEYINLLKRDDGKINKKI